ncbi:SLC13 family permease [Streptomyces sp. DSM 44915]|uniref:SLC13 family permease n=1 Tax=Streptomyces chisholmiae TaxID=3075540 RepID=A0ABU2JQM2_9ACTN|nr:SLC13 family permease [Streptomyces sp. DSM 44915]MDT0267285.1 SLC13 family permease [Streptomyces sp. DSM 44915]
MSDIYTLGAFAVAIAALVLLIARFKVHPVATLFLVVVTLGLVLGMGGTKTVELVSEGFGSTLAKVGLLVIFGCVLGKMLELSGAAERITVSALTVFPGKRAPWAVAVASVVLGIPLIADTAVVMLIPVVSALAYRTKISMMKLGPILYIGAYVMTSLVPPGPGPLAASGLLGVDFGEAMLWGTLVALPGIFVATLYLLTIKTHVDPKPEFVAHLQQPAGGGTGAGAGTGGDGEVEAKRLPPLWMSLVPVLLPIVLIVVSSYVIDMAELDNAVGGVIAFVGEPTIALFLGCLSALPLFGRAWNSKETLNDLFEAGLRLAALPIALTGVGGALAAVIRDTEVAESVADMIGNWGVSPIIVPFLVAAAICTITGSNILGVMTAAAIMEPLAEGLGISMLAIYLACGTGAQIMKHANSSGFWVTTTLSNLTVGQGIRSVGVASALSGVTGFAIVYLLYGLGLI